MAAEGAARVKAQRSVERRVGSGSHIQFKGSEGNSGWRGGRGRWERGAKQSEGFGLPERAVGWINCFKKGVT